MPVLDARSLDDADLAALGELAAILHPTGVARTTPRTGFTLPRSAGRVVGRSARTGGRRTAARSNSAA